MTSLPTAPTKLRILSSVASEWQTHRDKWNACTLCPLHKVATHKVLTRGTLPCDVLLIGEAPGENEDAVGRPFVGRAGRILQALLEALDERLYVEHHNAKRTPIRWTWAITNIVACKPFGAGEEIAPPPKESVQACSPRLIEFIQLARPKVIVLLGKVAEKRLLKSKLIMPFWQDQVIAVFHPSYINRKGGLNSLEFKRTLLSLTRFLKARL